MQNIHEDLQDIQKLLRSSSKNELLAKTKSLVSDERKIATQILWCIKEIESRRLHLEMGFGSIYDFAIQYLGYSEGSAHRRIVAARLLQSAQLSPQFCKPEKSRVLNANETEVRMTLDAELMNKIERLKSLISHQYPNPSFAKLLELLVDSELKRRDPVNSVARRTRRETIVDAKGCSLERIK